MPVKARNYEQVSSSSALVTKDSDLLHHVVMRYTGPHICTCTISCPTRLRQRKPIVRPPSVSLCHRRSHLSVRLGCDASRCGPALFTAQLKSGFGWLALSSNCGSAISILDLSPQCPARLSLGSPYPPLVAGAVVYIYCIGLLAMGDPRSTGSTMAEPVSISRRPTSSF